MRNIGLLTFGVTTCVLVPAAISQLTAGPQQVGKLVAPGASTIQVGDASIQATLDRAIVDPGGAIHLRLSGTAPTAKRVALGVLVYGSSGTEGGRVPDPPIDVAHQTVMLDLDGTAKDVKLALRGATALDAFAHYTIYVMPPKAADRLAALRDRSRVIPGTKDDPIPGYNKSAGAFMQLYWDVNRGEAPSEGKDALLFAPGAIARLEAHTRAKSSAIAMTVPETATVGKAYKVVVTVKNPRAKKLTDVEVELATPAGLLEQGYTGLRDDAVTVEPASIKIDLAKHETKRVEFTVTPKVIGVLGLYAHANTPEDYIRELEAGTVDATDVIKAEEANPIVGVR